MKELSILALVLLSGTARANVAVVNGQAYELRAVERKDCSVPGSPEFFADKVVLNLAKKNGLATAAALCAAGTTRYCSSDNQLKFALDLVFKEIRRYPSAFRSPSCKAIRSECEALCSSGNALTSDECQIECNQYEAWNK